MIELRYVIYFLFVSDILFVLIDRVAVWHYHISLAAVLCTA